VPVKAYTIKIHTYSEASYYVIPEMDIPEVLKPFIDYSKLEKEKAPKHVREVMDDDLYIIAKEPFRLVEVDYDYSVRIYSVDEVEIPDEIIPYLKEDVRKLLTE